ncbi:MAG: uroporphyrinogen-III synthase [Paracoccaceae bacterium]
MADQTSVMVLTRPDPSSRAFLAQCETALGHRIDSIISPIFDIVPVEADVNLNAFATAVLTSRNGVAQIGSRLSGRQIATVGARTAEAAQEFGAEAVCLGDTVDAFVKNASRLTQPVIHLHGRHTRGNLAARLNDLGIETSECVIYDQVERRLSDASQDALQSGAAIVPVFSPRAAALVSSYEVHDRTRVLAISDATAQAWNSKGLISVARHPDADSMCALVQKLL